MKVFAIYNVISFQVYGEESVLGIYSSKEAAYKAFKDFIYNHIEYAKELDVSSQYWEQIEVFAKDIKELIESISENVDFHTIWQDFMSVESKFVESTGYNINLISNRDELCLRELDLDQPLNVPL